MTFRANLRLFYVVYRVQESAALELFKCPAQNPSQAIDALKADCPDATVVSCLPFAAGDDAYVIYSANESSLGDGAGFWSNELGWVQAEDATRFSYEEARLLLLPISTGQDAQWVLTADVLGS